MTFDLLKEISQEALWLVGIVGGCVAAFKAISEMRQSTNQRHQELRWKRSQAARDLIKEIHQDPRAAAAVTMLDWSDGKHSYMLGSNNITISYADVLRAVSCHAGSVDDEKDEYIRDCFDWFIYYINRIEHYIRTRYIDFEDVQPVFKSYALKLLKELPSYKRLLRDREYELAHAFLNRYNHL